MNARTYLLATRSTGKLHELRLLFAQHGLHIIDLHDAGILEHPDEAAIESFDTFEANARAKSEYFQRLTSLPTFADDSGLVVHALHGAPGVRSKRWSGRDDLSGTALDTANNAKLLTTLHALSPAVHPTAEYICAAAFSNNGSTVIRVGHAVGTIVVQPAGANGFGYDPYFYSAELGKTFGEATREEKLVISHRGRAFQALIDSMLTAC